MASNTNRISTPPRADKWVKEKFPTLTKRQIDEALSNALVRDARGNALLKGGRLTESTALDVAPLESHLRDLGKGNSELEVSILFESSAFWVVDKPAGIPSHPLSLFDRNTLTHWALAYDPGVKKEFSEIQPTLTPHRLDGGTSGLIVVARTRAAFSLWRDWFQKKKVRKRYMAWCWGYPKQSFYEIDTPIAHHPKSKRKMVVIHDRFIPPVLKAKSFVRVLARKEVQGFFLCEISCHTGVTHQVRVHLASLGFPLLGDELYDPKFSERLYQPPHHLLRAVELRVEDKIWEADVSTFMAFEGTTQRLH